MTYHELIKRLGVDEMADVFCSFLKPWVGNVGTEEMNRMHQELVSFLESEVKRR